MIGQIIKTLAPGHAAKEYSFQHDGLIHFAEARRGRGKSYTLTNFVLEAAAMKKPIITNSQSLDFYRVAVRLVMRGTFSSLDEALIWLRDNLVVGI